MPNLFYSRITIRIIVALIWLATFPPVIGAQSGTTAELYGTVSDLTGAVLPGAIVTITFVPTDAQRRTTTGPDGTFLFLQLNAGAYTVSVHAANFASASQQINYSGAPIHLDF